MVFEMMRIPRKYHSCYGCHVDTLTTTRSHINKIIIYVPGITRQDVPPALLFANSGAAIPSGTAVPILSECFEKRTPPAYPSKGAVVATTS